MLALKPKEAQPAPVIGRAKPREHGQDEPEEHHAFICRRCESEITDSAALFCMRASSVVQVFPNPFGQMRKILTAKDARAILVEGAPTTEFTWFEGYAWRIVYCAGCRAHLGWIFDAMESGSGGGDPKTFFGLLESELAER